MASANIAAYCWDDFGPGKIKNNVAKLQNTGLTTAILFAVHVGSTKDEGVQHQDGDLIFNDDREDPANLFISQGEFNPAKNPVTGAWPGYVAQLKKGGVGKLFFSIGGGDVRDFTTIEEMFAQKKGDVLAGNFEKFKTTFSDPVTKKCWIDGFDLDCEEDVDQDTIVQFSQMLFEKGFQVTFCPYENENFWKRCMQTLWDQGKKISWWNLQCYSGGDPNINPEKMKKWIDALAAVVGEDAAPSYLLPGLPVMGSNTPTGDLCPDGIYKTFKSWQDKNLKLNGGWLWRYDQIGNKPCSGRADLTAYVDAINKGLGQP
jgi:hypothetical protein